jgi:hypothetical protein
MLPKYSKYSVILEEYQMSKRVKAKADIEEKQYILKPTTIPTGLRLRESFYDKILDDAMSDKEHNEFEVSVRDKDWKAIYAPLDCRIMKKKYPLKLVVRTQEGKLYLRKYPDFESMLKDRKTHHKRAKT